MPENNQSESKKVVQLIWGIALVMMGLAFFFRISEVMDKIAGMEQFSSVQLFIRFGFYLIGIILIGGGVKKIRAFFIRQNQDPPRE